MLTRKQVVTKVNHTSISNAPVRVDAIQNVVRSKPSFQSNIKNSDDRGVIRRDIVNAQKRIVGYTWQLLTEINQAINPRQHTCIILQGKQFLRRIDLIEHFSPAVVD